MEAKKSLVASTYSVFSLVCQDKGQQADLGPNYKEPTLPCFHSLTCLGG